MRRLSLVALLAILIALQACLSSLEPDFAGGVSPTPSPSSSPTGPTPTPTDDPYGEGLSGVLNVTSPTIVNACRRVLVVTSGVSLQVEGTTTPFATERRVLLHQVKTSSSYVSGPTTEVPPAVRVGTWAVFRLDSVASDELGGPVPGGFFAEGKLQICTMPEYTSASVGSILNADTWDDIAGTGGVIAFSVNGVMSVNGGISASARGFAGGIPSAASSDADYVGDETGSALEAGGKGEGLAPIAAAQQFGRGSLTISAGGGNRADAGGGGGGNGGPGGFGGRTSSITIGGGNTNARGYGGGAAFPSERMRLVLGGGGGGGHHRSAAGASGGRGGGVILIFARTIGGSGYIRANGENGRTGSGSPDCVGAGGGGAGGTILLYTTNGTSFMGPMEARGGDGGDAADLNSDLYCGPGGGGGGGRIVTRGGVGTTQVFADGGAKNITTGLELHGSTDGAMGIEDIQ